MADSDRGRRVVVGLAFLVIGVVFLWENVTDFDIPWGGWWPVILIAVGLWNIARNRSWFGGLVVMALGVFFLLDTQDVWEYTIGDIWRFWPVILILIGAKMLLSRNKKKKEARKGPEPYLDDNSVPGELDITTVFREDRRRVTDHNFSGGRITCVFGGAKLNLLDAALDGGEATLDVTAVFGGVSIRIPDSWIVDVQTTNLFGGVDDDRSPPSPGTAAGRLTITGTCLFGGLELES